MFSKIYYLFISLIVIFSACSKNDTVAALQYRESKILGFEVYAGSSTEHGHKIKTDSLDSIRYFRPAFENYVDADISIIGNQLEISHPSIKRERSLYEFRGDSLFIKNDGRWQYFGYGNSNNIIIRQQYIGYIKSKNAIKLLQGSLTKDSSVEEIIKKTPFGKLEAMNNGDTLMWCIRESSFY